MQKSKFIIAEQMTYRSFMVYAALFHHLQFSNPTHIVTRRPKAGMVEPNETHIARQRLGKHILATTDKHATMEEPVSKQRIGKHTTIGVLLDTVFSIRSLQSGYKEEFS
jgi:hypothetical protein